VITLIRVITGLSVQEEELKNKIALSERLVPVNGEFVIAREQDGEDMTSKELVSYEHLDGIRSAMVCHVKVDDCLIANQFYLDLVTPKTVVRYGPFRNLEDVKKAAIDWALYRNKPHQKWKLKRLR
jgi:hypothetical protein